MDESLLRAADQNYFGSMAVLMACSQSGESVQNYDTVISSSGFPLPEFNLVFLKAELRRIDDALEYGRAYFARRGFPHQFRFRRNSDRDFARPLAELGYRERAPVVGMVRALGDLPGPASTPLEIRLVDQPDSLRDFQRVAFEGFGHPVRSAPMFLTDRLLSHPEIACYIGYAGGQPVCTSMLVAAAGVAGIYWVATLPEHRRRGFGEAITWGAIRAGRERGLRTASLQASQMGQSVYARMGFQLGPLYLSYESPPLGR
jgi:ribosomal protein S18 acetylase RimI-like enzyme